MSKISAPKLKRAANSAAPKSAKARKNTPVSASKITANYNGYDYKKIFWEEADREYEDLADRLAVRRLLPKKTKKLVDIAGGYGRLADEYLPRAKQAVLFDYSKTELRQARQKYGKKLQTVVGDVYQLPFHDGEFSTLLMVRASHHLEDMSAVLGELNRVLEPGGIAVIEIANKRTLPRIMRYLTGKTKISPFDQRIANLTEINRNGFYNYHPKYIERVFREAGFEIEKVLSVSNFRSIRLKKWLGAKRLMALERPAQVLLSPVRFAPSIYYRLRKIK